MATSTAIAHHHPIGFVKREEKTIPDVEFAEDVDITEPSGPPVIITDLAVAPEPTPSRPIVLSLPSQYELDSERKSSPPVLERRKHFTKIVASCVGVAWFICIVAVGQTAMRSVFFH